MEKKDNQDEESLEDINSDSVKFYYSREERLKKLKRGIGSKKARFFSKKGNKRLFIIIFDLILLLVVIYFFNKPANVYLEKKGDNILYQLNITGVKGNKVLISFTINNQSKDRIEFKKSVPVIVKIIDKKGHILTYRKFIESNTEILKGETSSLVFLLDEKDLPGMAILEIYYEATTFPIFSKTVRF